MVQYYDIRKECEGGLCYDFSRLDVFLNNETTRAALGVGERKFVPCSPLVYEAMIVDWMKNLEKGIPALLEDGIELLVYAGEYDLICNWLGEHRHYNLVCVLNFFLANNQTFYDMLWSPAMKPTGV